MIDSFSQIPKHVDPVIFDTNFFSLRWYSVMYIFAFTTTYLLLRYRIKKGEFESFANFSNEKNFSFLDRLFIFLIIGVLVGARLGYFLFFDLSTLLSDPVRLIMPIENRVFVGFYGMSYHGGLIGAFISATIFCRKNVVKLSELADFVVPAAALGYFWGRIGNFINGELYGKQTDSVFGMVFPADPAGLPRHPTQLYEAMAEGLLIFFILWPIRNRSWAKGNLTGIYLILYSVARFLLEFIRVTHSSQYFSGLTIAQYLCIVMIITGLYVIFNKRPKKNAYENIGN